MGWTSTHYNKHAYRDRGGLAGFLAQELFTWRDGTAEVLAHATVNRKEHYAIVKRSPPNLPPTTFLAIVLLQFGRGEFNISYKDVCETMGPYGYNCPERILDLADKLIPLTPEYDPNGYAAEWRAKCRAAIAKRKTATKVKAGSIIKFAEPLSFSFFKADTFRVISPGRFQPIGASYSGPCRISRWKQREFEVAANIAVA